MPQDRETVHLWQARLHPIEDWSCVLPIKAVFFEHALIEDVFEGTFYRGGAPFHHQWAVWSSPEPGQWQPASRSDDPDWPQHAIEHMMMFRSEREAAVYVLDSLLASENACAERLQRIRQRIAVLEETLEQMSEHAGTETERG